MEWEKSVDSGIALSGGSALRIQSEGRGEDESRNLLLKEPARRRASPLYPAKEGPVNYSTAAGTGAAETVEGGRRGRRIAQGRFTNQFLPSGSLLRETPLYTSVKLDGEGIGFETLDVATR